MTTYYRNFNEAYPLIVADVRKNLDGIVCTPRGMTCRELRPYSFCLGDAQHAIYGGHDRKLNLRFMMCEMISYIADADQLQVAELLVAVNRNMGKFVNEDTKKFDGHYGGRITEGLDDVYEAIKKDKWTRQGVASVWNNRENRESKDVPCTLNFQFIVDSTLSAGKELHSLTMITNMRSNDVNWGLPYDVAAFQMIQILMAGVLNLDPGLYYHQVGSMHEYQENKASVTTDKHQRSSIQSTSFRIPKCRLETWDDVVRTANITFNLMYVAFVVGNEDSLKDRFAEYTDDPFFQFVARTCFRRVK